MRTRLVDMAGSERGGVAAECALLIALIAVVIVVGAAASASRSTPGSTTPPPVLAARPPVRRIERAASPAARSPSGRGGSEGPAKTEREREGMRMTQAQSRFSGRCCEERGVAAVEFALLVPLLVVILVLDHLVRHRPQSLRRVHERGSRGGALRRGPLPAGRNAMHHRVDPGARRGGAVGDPIAAGDGRTGLQDRDPARAGRHRLMEPIDPDPDPDASGPQQDHHDQWVVPMRVRRLSLNGEEGVTAVLIVLALTFLLGMVSMSVDGGFLFLKRRAMVTANDAAALAAAQSCAKSEGTGHGRRQGRPPRRRQRQQRHEVRGSGVHPSCNAPSGKVTVSYQGDQACLSQVVGISSPKVVRTQATATWGGAGAADGVVPLMLSANGGLGNCDIPLNVAIGQHCKFWWDNDPISNAQWGIIDILNGWDVARTGSCTGNLSANSVKQLIAGTISAGTLSLRNPPPTYACVSSGSGELPHQRDQRRGGDAGDHARQRRVPAGAIQRRTLSTEHQLHGREVRDHRLRDPRDVCRRSGEAAKNLCPGHTGNNGSIRHLDLIWRGYQTGGLSPGGGGSFGFNSVGLSG